MPDAAIGADVMVRISRRMTEEEFEETRRFIDRLPFRTCILSVFGAARHSSGRESRPGS